MKHQLRKIKKCQECDPRNRAINDEICIPPV